MMIPQLLATGASIEIYIKERIHPIIDDLTGANDGSGHPIDSKLKDWSTYAGKVITISLNSVFEGEHVDIEITDQVNANVKTIPTVTNTAEVGKDCYVRVAIVANWVKADGTVIYPYPIDNIATNPRFTGFDSSKWVFDNGFYYYKYKLKGASVKLFDKFTAPVSGDTDYESTVPDIDHLVVTIVAQGVDWEKKAEMISTYGWPDVFLN